MDLLKESLLEAKNLYDNIVFNDELIINTINKKPYKISVYSAFAFKRVSIEKTNKIRNFTEEEIKILDQFNFKRMNKPFRGLRELIIYEFGDKKDSFIEFV